MKIHGLCRLTMLALLLPGGSGTAAPTSDPAAIEDRRIVPCLLPARVRKLGGMVYPERRQLTKTTARQCELKGGEYTVYDRAAPEAAAAFFLPLAEAGDPAAQTSLGEVYEYLFEAPRYAEAARWYRRAADQGHQPAQRRLAHLHEHGLGVAKDALLATNLWRAAIGAGEDLVLASELEQVRSAAAVRIADLTSRLRARSSEADLLRAALADSREAVSARRAELAALQQRQVVLVAELDRARAGAVAQSPAVAELERELAERTRQIEDQQFEIASLEASLGAEEARLTANLQQLELENRRLAAELDRVAEASAEELESMRTALAQRSREIDALRAEREALTERLDDTTAQDQLARVGEQLARAEAAAARLQAGFDQAVAERERAEADLARTESELVAARQRLSGAERELARVDRVLADERRAREQLTAQLDDAGTASPSADRLRAAVAERDDLIARYEAQLAELAAQTERARSETVRLREQWSFQLATRGEPSPLPDTSQVRIPADVKMGRYYAVVIGNNNYQHLRPLKYAQNDARALHELLTEQYGFRSELLLDTTRGQLFAHLESLSAVLRPEDALLLYYAGHGVEDGRISHWLGVDAPSSRSALQTHGVSSNEIGQWLSVLEARHVMVIADSCYSGAGIENTGGVKFTADDVQSQLRFFLQNRARTTLTSGGDGPVPDGGAGEHSVFTRTLLTLLSHNQGVLFDSDMYAHMKEQLRFGQVSMAVPEPVFGRIELAGHGAGQFAFIRPRLMRL